MPLDTEHLANLQDMVTALINALRELAASQPKVPSTVHHVISVDPSLLWLVAEACGIVLATVFVVLLWRKK